MNRLDLLPEDVIILVWRCVFNEVLQELPKTLPTLCLTCAGVKVGDFSRETERDNHGAWYYGSFFYDSSSTEFDSDYD